jgi:hypothetical protein
VWRDITDEATGIRCYLYATTPIESAQHPVNSHSARAKMPSAIRITRLAGDQCKIEFVVQINFGGKTPAWLANKCVEIPLVDWTARLTPTRTPRYASSTLALVSDVQTYFQSQREVKDWDSEDGIAIGEALAVKVKEERHPRHGESRQAVRVRVLFRKYAGLREFGAQHEWFQPLMTRIVENRLRPPVAIDVKMCNLSEKQADGVGAGLSVTLAVNLTSKAAVDEWIGEHKASERRLRRHA